MKVGDLVALTDEYFKPYREYETIGGIFLGPCWPEPKEKVCWLLVGTNFGSQAMGSIEEVYYWFSDYFDENDDADIEKLTPEIEE